MQDAANFHAHYADLTRYWSALSEKYAGGDCLLTLLQKNWKMDPIIYREEYWHAGTRPVVIYHFHLERNDVKVNMPVLNNPYVNRLIRTLELDVHPFEEREAMERARSRIND